MAGRDYFIEREQCGAQGLDVVAGEFVVATAAAADIHEYTPLSALLDRVRKAFGIEAAFVSVRGPADRGELDALQRMYGLRLLESEACAGTSFRYDAVPVVTDDGIWHGTLCCRRPRRCGHGGEPADADALRSVARLIANWFDEAQLAVAG